MEIKFSAELQTILCYARDEAMRTGCYGLGADHIALGLLRHRDNDACRILSDCGVDLEALKDAIDRQLFAEQAVPWQDEGRIRPTRAAAALVGGAAYEALKQGRHDIFSTHLLLALVRHEESTAADLLRLREIGYDRLFALMRERELALPVSGTVLPRMEELLGPLGEQLTRLWGDAQAQTNILS